MAITKVSGNRGTATEKTADQTLDLTPNATLAAGNYGLLFYVGDNVSTAEGATSEVSVTDSAGNTWTRVREQTEANTAALTGVTVAAFIALLNTQLTTGSTISIALTANATAKGAGLAEYSVGAGNVLVALGANGQNQVGGASYSVATTPALSSVPHEYVGMIGAEEETDAFVTLDTAYTEIGFGSIGSGIAGGNITNVRARVGTLVETSTGNTFNASVSAADKAAIVFALEEQASTAVEFPMFAHPDRSIYPGPTNE